MIFDIGLSIILGLSAVYMAYLGVEVTIHPPTNRIAKRNLKIKFITCAVIVIAITVAQGLFRQNALEERFKKTLTVRIPGSIQFAGYAPLTKEKDKPFLKENSPLLINVLFANGGGSAVEGMNLRARIQVVRARSVDGPQLLSEFKQYIASVKSKNLLGFDLPTNGFIYHSEKTDQPLSKDDISDIVAGRLLIFVLVHAWSKENPDGIYVCNKAERFKSKDDKLEDIAWGNCGY